MRIPISFRDKNENYLIKGTLQKFCKKHDLPTSEDKMDLIGYIEEFASRNNDNEEIVLEWLETVLKEGAKHIIIRKCDIPKIYEEYTDEKWEEFIDEQFGEIPQYFICGGVHYNTPKCLSYQFEYDEDNKVKSINFSYTIELLENKSGVDTLQKITYPIFVDVDLINKVIIGRVKSKNKIYEYVLEADGHPRPNIDKAQPFKIATQIMHEISEKLLITFESIERSKNRWSSNLFELINECTQTPKEIIKAIDKEQNNVNSFITGFFERHNISLIEQENFIKAKEDLNIFMEKFLSINLGDEEIFKEGRIAYPVKIAATDTDYTSVEQSTSNRRPLQATAVFYDNKKILLRKKQCDKISMVFKREKQSYFTNEEFLITFEIKKGYCLIKSESYLLEEDIKDVLSRIIKPR